MTLSYHGEYRPEEVPAINAFNFLSFIFCFVWTFCLVLSILLFPGSRPSLTFFFVEIGTLVGGRRVSFTSIWIFMVSWL